MTRELLYLGIDAGSSVTKAAMFNARGSLIARADCRSAIVRGESGRVEMDPQAAREIFERVLRELLEAAPVRGAELGGIGITGAMVGAWLVDGAGAPVARGINWEDCRAQPSIDARIAEDPAFLSTIFASSGSALQSGCTLPLLAWFDAHEPELLDRAAAVLGYKDMLRFWLTGEMAADETEASVAPGDTRARGFSAAMLDHFRLAHRAGLLPAVRPSDALAGRVTAEAAGRCGLGEGTPVAVGAGDVPANVVGAGALAPGSLTLVLGTTCMLGVTHDRPVFDPPDLGLLFPLPRQRWFRAMVNVAGTLALDWALDTLCPDWGQDAGRYERAERTISEVPPGAGGVTFLPYLSESGIIAPVIDPTARAEFAGLSPGRGRAQMLRAVYEGVGFAIADLVEALAPGPGELRIIGGGARSRVWVQMIADILDRPVTILEGEEFGARGAAMLAAAATAPRGAADPLFEMAPRGKLRVLPDPARHAAYADALRRYRAHRDTRARRTPD
ncbi:putative carbohydrate kinase [Oceanicola granulosus HTCC2516]|uniref:Putative carbohydrate kinase n=1 Tax=Oceanicola granulosus (strain ATCC BAA-861 / DSM 15982 / KCTC 12143 / HTCC2516) TaxID=314256 RepID=Q2CF28_OCEGH|nr:FGGY-family carbohydrate kinase [Oceanicola granulosus]EAR51299.1 putative carbohydrate kinase [Oceanicola granulosus HTCC2516]